MIHYENFRMGLGTHLDKINDDIVYETIMATLMTNDHRPGKPTPIPEKLPKEKITFLLNRVTPILSQEPTLLEVEPPIVICGDTHGQFCDLLDIMNNIGMPPKRRYLFMGDYVDRGDQSIELICFVFLLKCQYPENFFLLRGNHETAEINASYGFKEDCLLNYDIAIWDMFQESFKCLPLAAVVGSRILCMHGGLSQCWQDMDDLRKLPRPLDIPENGLACDILWSDPAPYEKQQYAAGCCGFIPNRARSTSVYFCPDAVAEFLKRNELDLVVRGHELVDDGYSFTPDKKVLTIFTAPYYCDHPNDAAALSVDEQLRCQILTFKFKKYPSTPGTPLPSTATSITANELWNEITVRESDQRTAASEAIALVPHGAATASQAVSAGISSPTSGPISQPVLVATPLPPTSVTPGPKPIFKPAKTNEK